MLVRGDREIVGDCFESVDWATFKDSSTDLNEDVTIVTQHHK